jgi:Tol biopolymer transport system component
MCAKMITRTVAVAALLLIPVVILFTVWYFILRTAGQPDFSIEGPKVIAEGFDGRGSSIYMMNIDGSECRKLLSGSMPDVSVCGTYIAYVSDEDGGCLHLFSLATMDDNCLTSPVSVRNPRWSHDGRSITFTSVYDGLYQVFVLELREVPDTTHIPIVRRVTSEPRGAMYPAFSGDDEWIYYNLPYRYRNLMRIHVTGIGNPEPVSETGSDWYNHASVHPTEGGILFSGIRSRRLYYIESPGSRRETILALPITADPILFPRWVGPGREIIFCAQLERERTPQIYMMQMDDRIPHRVTDPDGGIRWRSASVRNAQHGLQTNATE